MWIMFYTSHADTCVVWIQTGPQCLQYAVNKLLDECGKAPSLSSLDVSLWPLLPVYSLPLNLHSKRNRASHPADQTEHTLAHCSYVHLPFNNALFVVVTGAMLQCLLGCRGLSVPSCQVTGLVLRGHGFYVQTYSSGEKPLSLPSLNTNANTRAHAHTREHTHFSDMSY